MFGIYSIVDIEFGKAYVQVPQGGISLITSAIIDVLQLVILVTGILINLDVDTVYKHFIQLPAQ
jgi:hypothetical protein